MATIKVWESKRIIGYIRIIKKSWLEVYTTLFEKDMLANQHEYIPYAKAVLEKNNIDWKDYQNYLDECLVCDIYGYAKREGIELVDLTEDELKALIYNETIHEWDCKMIEYKYSIKIKNKLHTEIEQFETLEEAREKLAEIEEEEWDKENGNYKEDFYRIIDLETGKTVE